jgi:hypothetical protein
MDNLVNSLVNKSVGKLTNQLIIDGLKANPNMSQQQLSKTLGVSMQEIAGALNEDVKKSGYQTTSIPNAETGQAVSDIRDIGGGFQAYQDENGQTSGFSRVDPSKPGMIQLYGPQGEFRGEQKITSTTQDMLKNLGPIALAAGGTALAGYLGAGGTGSTFAGEALADANLLSSGTNLSSLASTGAPFGGEALADANLLSNTGAGSSFEALNAGSTAMSDLGASELANAGASANTASNVANAAKTANALSAADALKTGLTLKSLADVTGAVANQSGISDARDLINKYGTDAKTALENAYADQKNVYAGNRGDLVANFDTAKGDLADTLASQRGIYDTTNTNLATNYQNAQTKLGSIYDQQVGFQQPYQEVGQAGSQGLLDNQGYLTRQFNTADLYSGLAPNYQFQLEQGQMANRRAANMGGGSMGGNAMRGLQDYTQNYAGGAYQNAFNNFNTQRQNIYSNLAGMANIGTTSAGQLASLGNTYGSNLGSLSSNYGGNMVTNTGQMQGAYNQYGSNLTNLNTNLGSNLTSSANAALLASGQYGTNQANLATGVGGALAGNVVASGANTSTALSNLGNTALLGSIIKAT